MIQHYPRWIIASIYKHIETNKDIFAIYYEGLPRYTQEQQVQDYIEARIDGPHFLQRTSTQYIAYIQINFLITVRPRSNDIYAFQRISGKAVDLLSNCIEVKKYGSDSLIDTNQLIGYLKRIDDPRNMRQVNNFGMIDINLEVQQGSVEARYELKFTEG